jgi:hypothetical protein
VSAVVAAPRPARSSAALAREIARTTLRLELRRTRGVAAARGQRGGLVASFLVYLFTGVLTGLSLARGIDPFTVGLFSTTAFMLLVAVFVVMEFATIVTGPDDLAFYAPLPVPPVAYVAAKIGVTCLFALAFAVTYTLPGIVILAAFGRSPSVMAGSFFELADGSLISALGVIAILGFAVRAVSYKRARETASWVQFVIFIAVYGGFSIFQRALGSTAGVRLSYPPALLLAPSAWGPSIFRLGEGVQPAAGFVLAILAPVLLGIAAVRIVSRLYEGTLAEAEAARELRGTRARPAGRGSLLWRSPEEKGIALLIGNLFRHDSQFRMGVLTIIPVTLLYVGIIVFANRTPLLDPFTAAGRATFGGTILLYLAVGFYPSYMKNALTYSSSASASWLITCSPADPLLILRAARRFIMVFFILPYLLALGAAYAIFTGQLAHTIQHFGAIALLVVIETDILLLFFPQIPFSRAATTGRRGGAVLLRMLAGVVILLPLYLMVLFVYPHPAAYWAALAALLALAVGVRVLGGRYAGAKLAREEFTT